MYMRFILLYHPLLFTGRGRNIWLSPMGCAMFTLQVHISKNSFLGGRIPLLQHIAAVAVISAIRSIAGYEVLFYIFFYIIITFQF